MKKHYTFTKILISLFLTLAFIFNSCTELEEPAIEEIVVYDNPDGWIDYDLNADPNHLAALPMDQMLPAIEQAMAYRMSGVNTVRVTNSWTQHFELVNRGAAAQSKYLFFPTTINQLWTSIYVQVFINSKTLIDKAENTSGIKAPHFAGIGRVITATTLGISTDLFGEMPFSDIFEDQKFNFYSRFDTQEELYDTIVEILDAAIVNLNSTNTIPVEGDLIYNGNIDKWIKAAYSIKARHALQLSTLNGQNAYLDALNAASKGFTSIDDDFEVTWETNMFNPLYEFMQQRSDLRMAATLIDLMKLDNDPRLPFYANEDSDGEISGTIIGSNNYNNSPPGSFVAAEKAPSILMSFSELKFIEAEAQFMLGNTQEAQNAFKAAVTASVLKVTEDANTAWLDEHINNSTLSLELILSQKYIASIGTNQAYADFRRTGFPTFITQFDGDVHGIIPMRFPYPTDEFNFYQEDLPNVTIYDNLWWDQ